MRRLILCTVAFPPSWNVDDANDSKRYAIGWSRTLRSLSMSLTSVLPSVYNHLERAIENGLFRLIPDDKTIYGKSDPVDLFWADRPLGLGDIPSRILPVILAACEEYDRQFPDRKRDGEPVSDKPLDPSLVESWISELQTLSVPERCSVLFDVYDQMTSPELDALMSPKRTLDPGAN
jgi:hypothetical protein